MADTCSVLTSGRLPHRLGPDVDLAGDGGGDQGGTALLQEVDGSSGVDGESIQPTGVDVDTLDDGSLFRKWWEEDGCVPDIVQAQAKGVI